jgi:3-deoxy-D-manno-octulosonic acid kinase
VTRVPVLPDGFAATRASQATLIAEESLLEPLTALGLDRPDGWRRQLGSGSGAPGRGAIGRLELPGESLVLKQMRRGGWLGPVWRDRYPGVGRLLDNLTLPLRVARLGIATAEPVALLLVPGPPAFHRGWLATRRIEDTEDLMRRFASASPPDALRLQHVIALVRRMHDTGIEHPDLNLGNLLLRDGPSGPEAFVVDLDRVRLHGEPLSFGRRQRAVRRLERSFLKQFGSRPDAPDWYGLYAAGDTVLADGFRRGRPVGRLLERLHRLGWRG